MIERVTEKRRAVVIGVDSLDPSTGVQKLTTAVKDAEALYSLLQKEGNFTVRKRTNEQATKEQLLEDLKWLFPLSTEVQNGELPEVSLFYFSGYGAGLSGYTGNSNEAYNGNLVTYDFNPVSPGSTGFALTELSERVRNSPVQQKVIWLDSDYSGRFIELIKKDNLPQNIFCFIAASGSNEPAYDNEYEHGVFTNALLQSLDPEKQPEKQVTNLMLAEIFQSRYTELKSKQYGKQHPVVFNSGLPILLTQANVRHLSGYSADVTEGRDLIGIDQDVKAFATLIAAQSVVPPLSIGIFGDWGSGKTFFMRQLRKAIDNLAIEAQKSEKPQRELAFYKRIVQIEFNAWQYVEGNLWASLVEHIFENLQVVGETTVSEQLRKHLIDNLRSQEKIREQADLDLHNAKKEAEEKGKQLDDARAELENKKQELNERTFEQDVRTFLLPDVQPFVNELLTQIGIQSVGQSARELENGLNQARNVLEQGASVLTPLFYTKDAKERRNRWRVLLLSLIAAPFIGWVLGIIPALLGAETIAQITALAGGIATLLTTGTQWIRKQADWLNAQTRKLWVAQCQYEKQLEDKLATNRLEIAKLEQELSQQQVKVQDAQQRKEEADRQVAEMQALVDQATPANLLADFIQDRVASDDYRKHLGLLAIIHNDFKQLSELMEEENWRLAPDHPDDSQVRWKSQKYEDLKDEASSRNTRINRIVLYIDDLDRCPPNKVVDVLQAIHLLLAFPLFVVVVGVDARWITRSLETRYRRLLNDSTEESQGITNLIGKATPHDYLEKIFQIPFWLQPMSQSACQEMVKGLLEKQVQPEGKTTPSIDQQNIGEGVSGQDEVQLTDQPPSSPFSDDKEIKLTSDSQQPLPGMPGVKQLSTPLQNTDRPTLSTVSTAESLLIDRLELQFIQEDLAPLLGRSPRALKRFINVYRLIKAQYELKVVAPKSDLMSDYQAVLFLVAMDTGTPDIAPAFFRLLLQSVDQDQLNKSGGSPVHNLDWLLEKLKSDSSVAKQIDWDRLRSWLNAPKARQLMGNNISPLFKWAEPVVRYSFHGGFERN